MRKIVVMILFVAFTFLGCNNDSDDEIVFPKSRAELIAEKISSYNTDKAILYRWNLDKLEKFEEDVTFEIEVPFLIYYDSIFHNFGNTAVKHYLLLDDCCHIYRYPGEHSVMLYFK